MTQKSKAAFTVEKREKTGKSIKKARNAGVVIANIFGLSKPSEMIQLDKKSFAKLYDQTGDTGLAYLKIGEGKEQAVLLDEIQRQSVTEEVLHVTFRRVDLAEKIEAEVPVELVGENEVHDAIVLLVRDSLQVVALPTDLPEKFEIDISQLTEVGQSITLNDLEYDRSVVELVMTGEMTAESPMVILQEVKEEVEEEEVSPEDVELVGEGEEAAEGEGGADAPAQDGADSGDSAE